MLADILAGAPFFVWRRNTQNSTPTKIKLNSALAVQEESMQVHGLKFSGALIERGFWLYVWKVDWRDNRILYVGRTGDSSSKYAASPFNRLGQHLDIRPKATANTLLRNIKSEGFDPAECQFELIAIGPLFPEQDNIDDHRKYRDIISPLESGLAQYLKGQGYNVIGNHPKKREKDEKLFKKIITKLNSKL